MLQFQFTKHISPLHFSEIIRTIKARWWNLLILFTVEEDSQLHGMFAGSHRKCAPSLTWLWADYNHGRTIQCAGWQMIWNHAKQHAWLIFSTATLREKLCSHYRTLWFSYCILSQSFEPQQSSLKPSWKTSLCYFSKTASVIFHYKVV